MVAEEIVTEQGAIIMRRSRIMIWLPRLACYRLRAHAVGLHLVQRWVIPKAQQQLAPPLKPVFAALMNLLRHWDTQPLRVIGQAETPLLAQPRVQGLKFVRVMVATTL